MVKHSQSSQNIKFAMSWQYLKKEGRDRVQFLHAHKHQSFYQLTLSFLMEVARHIQSTQNRKLVIFLQYEKSTTSTFVFYCDAKYSDTWWGSSHVCCYLFIVNYSKWFKERILFEALAACAFLCNAVLYPGVGLGTLSSNFLSQQGLL